VNGRRPTVEIELITMALEDAAVYREWRAASFCHACVEQSGRCPDHSADLDRAADYRDMVRGLTNDGIDSRPVDGNGSPDATTGALTVKGGGDRLALRAAALQTITASDPLTTSLHARRLRLVADRRQEPPAPLTGDPGGT
jgi:hypothetical protein